MVEFDAYDSPASLILKMLKSEKQKRGLEYDYHVDSLRRV
jgi:hypothetical protein